MSTERGSAARLILLLKLIAQQGAAFGLKDLSARAALPQATVHRLLKALVASGLVERGEQRSYHPGRELFRIAALLQARFDMSDAARPLLETLWKRWRETCVFCIYNPTSRTASVVEVVHSTHPLRFSIEPGAEMGLPWGALGRSILAELGEDEREEVLRSPGRTRFPGQRIKSVAELRKKLERIHAQGYESYQNPELDLSGVAAPVFGRRSSVMGSIGIVMPSHRFRSNEVSELAARVKHAASEMSTLMQLDRGAAASMRSRVRAHKRPRATPR